MEGISKQVVGIILAIFSGVLHTSVGFLIQLGNLNFSDVIFVQGVTNSPFILALGLFRGISLVPPPRLGVGQPEDEFSGQCHRLKGRQTTMLILILQGKDVHNERVEFEFISKSSCMGQWI